MPFPRTGLPRSLAPFYDWLTGAASAGAVPALTGVVATEEGVGHNHQTVLTFTNYALPLVDAAGVVAYAGVKVWDFPEGIISIRGAVANLAITKSSAGVNADFDGDFSLGTVTASNNATLSSTEQNIIPTTPTPQAVAGATTAKGASTGPVQLDGTTTAIDAFLNFLVDDVDQDVTTTPCNLILNGTLTITWVKLGDY